MTGRTSRCDEVIELIEAYALGASTAEEAAFVERHLADCPDALAALADYLDILEAMDHLPATKEENKPSKRPPLPPLEPQASPLVVLPPPPKPDPEPEENPRGQAPNGVGRRYRIASVAAMILLVGLNLALVWQNNQLNTQFAALQQTAQQLANAPQAANYASIGNTVTHRSVAADVEQHGSVHGVFAWDEETQIGTFYVAGLAVSAPERLYQLWLLRDDEAVLLGSVDVDSSEQGILIFQSSEPLAAYTSFMLTTEPEDDETQRAPLIGGEI